MADFGSDIAGLVHEAFDKKVPSKKGFPQEGQEWTVLSGIVLEDGPSKTVVSLGTGTNCLGQSETSPEGILVHDSHAEVLCKRAFVSYLMDELEVASRGCDSIFRQMTTSGTSGCKEEDEPSSPKKARLEEITKQFELKEEVKFHFYSSHPPCGDATISPKSGEDDIHRTGAKCPEDLGLNERDGAQYHALGAVRTKPGRGDPTASLSCSDKMTKWNLVGLQGSLVAAVTTAPIWWASITVGGGCCLQSLDRALFKRLDSDKVQLHSSTVPFRFQKKDSLRPCRNSIAYNTHALNVVVVEGRKQGVVKKHFNTDKAAVAICRKNMARKFSSLGQQVGISRLKDCKTYQELKSACKSDCSWNYLVKRAKFDALVDKSYPDRAERRTSLDQFNLHANSE